MKTISLKKVAVVAVASLGFGLLSVVPANAATQACVVVNNAAGATTTPTVGSPVVVSVTLTCTGTVTAQQDFVGTVTPSITTSPTNKTAASVAAAGITASVSTNAIPTSTGTVAVGTGSNTHKLIYTQVSGSANPNAVMGTFSFTPSTSGYYVMTLTPAVTTASPSATDTETFSTAVEIGINVGGGSLVQAASGLGASTGTQAVGLNAAAAFHIPAGSTTSSRYKIEATGATINDARTITTVTDVTSATTFTATTGITTNTPSSYATGITFVGQASTTSVLTGTSVTDGVVVSFTSATAGEATVTMKSMNTTTGVLTTVGSVTVTFGAAPAISAANSTAFLSAGSDCATSDDVGGVTLAKTASTSVQATICVLVKDQNAVAFNGAAITATISGPGLISIKTSNTTGDAGAARAAALTATTQAATNASTIGISADGTAGVGTITITAGTTVIATKSITFYGSAAKYTATTILNAVADGTTTSDAVLVCATDSAGIAVPGATIYATSGDTNVATVTASASTVSSAVLEDLNGATADTDPKTIAPTTYQSAKAVGCAGFAITAVNQITKDSVVITFRDSSTAALATVTGTATVKVGSAAASSITLTADKSSYAAGEKMVLTLTFKDAYGRLIGAGPGTATLDDVLVSSASLSGDALFAANNNTKLGVKTATVYAPLSGGTLTISGETGVAGTYVALAAASKALSLTPTVANPNAALLTQIDALNAKIVALNALIAKIMKKLGVK